MRANDGGQEPRPNPYPEITISDEAISASGGDLLGQIQRRAVDAYIARERAALAAIADDYTAWMFYPPTPHDDPAEYAPYWVRLSDFNPQH